MSLATPRSAAARPRAVRGELVVALQGVEGLVAYPTAPDQATAGAAWPKWVQTTYDGPLCSLGRDVYEILVTLPASYAEQTVDEGDSLRDVVALALLPVVSEVTFAEPAQITFNDRQTMPGLRLRIVTE